ncbi:unnamed protein product [Allacma fusca]|uniref:Uncharacterized protein n=1 Tax=Allacma fusca TaxID=39272 RepID=A0A8J2JRB0_9HEXA|nr:unnamed protein product [Allacma fusca]
MQLSEEINSELLDRSANPVDYRHRKYITRTCSGFDNNFWTGFSRISMFRSDNRSTPFILPSCFQGKPPAENFTSCMPIFEWPGVSVDVGSCGDVAKKISWMVIIHLAGFLKILYVMHRVYLINSAAHIWGDPPYDKKIMQIGINESVQTEG